jgi:putrescine importer
MPLSPTLSKAGNISRSEGRGDTLRPVLRLGGLVFYGIAFMVPLTLFTTYGLVTARTRGLVPLAYALTTACMIPIALSYARLAKEYPAAGSVYTYASMSMGPAAGFLAGWVLLMGYAFLPMLNYLVSAIFLSAAFPRLPRWVWVIAFIAVVSAINHLGIRLADVVNRVIVCAQIAFLLFFVGLLISHTLGERGAAGLLNFSAFLSAKEITAPGLGVSALAAGAAVLALSFLGFDAISTLGEEAVKPKTDIPRAIMLACLGAGLCFIAVTYFMGAAWPFAWREMKSPDGGSYELIVRVGGAATGYAFTFLYAAGCLASSVTSVASASRVLYGMGRDGILPRRIFGRLHPRRKTPTSNILIIGALSFAALWLPLETAAALVNFGALLAFAAVNLSVIVQFFGRERRRRGLDALRYLIVPALGAAVSLALWFKLDSFAKLAGFGWLAVGGLYLLIARLGRHDSRIHSETKSGLR